MNVYKIKSFSRFCRKEGIGDHQLLAALDAFGDGHAAVNLGGDVFKLRVARRGGGKSGGFRTIVAVRMGERALFLFGFAKSDRDNLSAAELDAAKALAREGLNATEGQITLAVAEGRWTKVNEDDACL